MTESSNNRVAYLDYIRLMATIGVVVIHVALTFTQFNDGPIDNQWHIVNIVESFVRWSVPIFVMISGVSFLCLKKELTLKELYRKYILRLFLCFVCWNAFYYLCSYGAAFFRGSELPGISHLLVPFGHLWFLPMMIGVYMVIPFMRAIYERLFGGYFVLLWFVCLTISHVFGNEWLQPLLLTMCLGYPGYFLLGCYLHTSKRVNDIKTRIWIVIFIFSVVLIAILTRWNTGGDIARTKYFEYVTPLVMSSSLSVFMLVKCLSSVDWLRKYLDKLLAFTRKDLFGIYLIHLFWINIIPHIGIADKLIHSNVYAGVPLMTILVFVISLLSTKMLRLIPFVNKLV